MLQIFLLLSVTGGTAAAGGPDAASNPFATSPVDASRILAPDSAAPALETFYGPLLPQDVAEQAAQSTTPQEPAPAHEEYYDNIYHTFELDAGGALYGDFNTELQVSTPAVIGAILSLEDELGVSQSASVLRADMQYKFNRRNGLQLSYYDIRRDGEKTIPNDIIVGGVTIPAGSVETEFDTLILKFNYQYNFVAEPRVLIGASIGVFWINLQTSIRSQTVNIEQSFEGNAPLPVLGLHGSYALAAR